MKTLASASPWKRVFDLVVTVLLAPAWLPVCLVAALALRLTAGAPVTYSSQRRVFLTNTRRITKFRTMVRNAEQVLNRETVPITDTCFLNIPPEHPVYTRVGRVLERFALTELPQLLHVLMGDMSLVGNRPLPENVIRALRQRYPYAEDRFLAPTGLTGPVQLVGRDSITDAERLAIEIDYCLLSIFEYRCTVDAMILWNTVAVALKLRRGFTVTEVRALLAKAITKRSCRLLDANCRRHEALRFRVRQRRPMLIDGDEYLVSDFGYRGLRLTGTRPLAAESALNFVIGGEQTANLQASVRWSRQLADGQYEAGLAVAPDQESMLHLGRFLQVANQGQVQGHHALAATSH